MQEITNESFEKEVLQSKVPVLVDFWAPWCGPCKFLTPTLEKLSKEYTHKLKFTKLNVDDAQDIAMKYDVRGIPCMIIFNNGQEIERVIGNFPESTLRNKFDLALTKV